MRIGCHPRGSGDPVSKLDFKYRAKTWIPAFAGMTIFAVSLGFAEPHAYPVPFTPSRNPAQTEIVFTDLPSSGTIRIYTIDGRLVADLNIPAGAGLTSWPVTNTKGEKVATGIYIYQIDGDGQKTEGKLVVIR